MTARTGDIRTNAARRINGQPIVREVRRRKPRLLTDSQDRVAKKTGRDRDGQCIADVAHRTAIRASKILSGHYTGRFFNADKSTVLIVRIHLSCDSLVCSSPHRDRNHKTIVLQLQIDFAFGGWKIASALLRNLTRKTLPELCLVPPKASSLRGSLRHSRLRPQQNAEYYTKNPAACVRRKVFRSEIFRA